MNYLVDTNILLRFVDRAHAQHAIVRTAIRKLRMSGGVQVHDARLIAAMKVASVTHILTFNTIDFSRYGPEGIIAIHPASI